MGADMVALVIEDGTGKPDANTYATLEQARDFASSRGISLPDDDTTLTNQLIASADFITTYEDRFKGQRSFPKNPQALSFPRDEVFMYGDNEMPDAYVPSNTLTAAQVYIAQAIGNGIVLFPTQFGPNVTRETVGPITTEYQENTWTDSTLPIISAAEQVLKPLFNGGGTFWQTVRV